MTLNSAFLGDKAPKVMKQDASQDFGTNIRDWIVFSDLHVSSKTLDVCLEVLRQVRDIACARQAGIIFLGKPCSSRPALVLIGRSSAPAVKRGVTSLKQGSLSAFWGNEPQTSGCR